MQLDLLEYTVLFLLGTMDCGLVVPVSQILLKKMMMMNPMLPTEVQLVIVYG
jgi:hypothetical protein